MYPIKSLGSSSGVDVDVPLGRMLSAYWLPTARHEMMKKTPLYPLCRPVDSSRQLVLLPRFQDVLGRHFLNSVTVLEDREAGMNSELDVDMVHSTRDCREVNKELMELLITVDSIQAKTKVVRRSKRGLSSQLVRVMDVNERKLGEAEEYVRIKKENLQLRMRDVSCQLKTAKNREVSDYMEYIMRKVAILNDARAGRSQER